MRKRICFFIGDMSRGGGTERMTQLLANELSRDTNYEIYVLSKRSETEKTFYPLDEKIKYNILDTKKYHGLRSVLNEIRGLKQFVKSHLIDILINVDTSIGMESLPLKVLCPELKQIFWDHFGANYDDGKRWTKMLTLIRPLALKSGDAYVVITPEDKLCIQNLVKKPCVIRHIENICAYTKADHEYSLDSKTIISAGRLTEIKGFDYALQVAQMVFLRHKDWNWRIYGNGSDIDVLRAQAVKLGLEKNVHFMGATQHLDEAYKNAAIFVMTSRQEPFGLVLIEAQSFQLPTVAFDVPNGPRNIINDNVNGFLCKPFDIDEMADKICELIEDEEKRNRFSSCSQLNLYKFSTTRVGEKWKQLLEII